MVADAKVTEFKNIINNSTITDATVENLFDLIANTYNIFGNTVPNMAGTAGGKTVTYTSAEKGAVFQGARVVFVSFYMNAENKPTQAIGAISEGNVDLMSNTTVWGMLKDIAAELKAQSSTYPRIAFRLGVGT